jgi:hypothetical protein
LWLSLAKICQETGDIFTKTKLYTFFLEAVYLAMACCLPNVKK